METNPNYQRDISPELIFEGDLDKLRTYPNNPKGYMTPEQREKVNEWVQKGMIGSKVVALCVAENDALRAQLTDLLARESKVDPLEVTKRHIRCDVCDVIVEENKHAHGRRTFCGDACRKLRDRHGLEEARRRRGAPVQEKDRVTKMTFFHFTDDRCVVCDFDCEHVAAVYLHGRPNGYSIKVCRDCADALQRAAHCWKPIPGGDWLPIETYFDGKVSHKFVGLCGPDFMCVGLWDSDSSHDWIDGFGEPCAPTHWIPLPSHPLEEFRANHQAAKVATEPVVAGFEMVRIINCADIRYSVMKGRVQVGVAVMNNEGIFTFVIEPSCRDEFLANLVDRYAVVAPS